MKALPQSTKGNEGEVMSGQTPFTVNEKGNLVSIPHSELRVKIEAQLYKDITSFRAVDYEGTTNHLMQLFTDELVKAKIEGAMLAKESIRSFPDDPYSLTSGDCICNYKIDDLIAELQAHQEKEISHDQ